MLNSADKDAKSMSVFSAQAQYSWLYLKTHMPLGASCSIALKLLPLHAGKLKTNKVPFNSMFLKDGFWCFN